MNVFFLFCRFITSLVFECVCIVYLYCVITISKSVSVGHFEIFVNFVHFIVMICVDSR